MTIARTASLTLATILCLSCAPLTAKPLETSPATGSSSAPAADQATFTAISGGIEARIGNHIVRVVALTDTLLRVRIAPNGSFPEDASWAVSAQTRAQRAKVTPLTNGFATSKIHVQIDPATLGLTVTDADGKVITADTPQQPLEMNGTAFTVRKQLPLGQHIYGLGDKTGGSLDRRGHSYVDWNTDAWGFDSSTDPIYKSIPFFIASGGPGGSYGILFDNTWRAWFDFAHKTADVLTFGAPQGPIDYYVIAGPQLRDVVRRYTDLTGKAPLTPIWGLGYQQSRYSYMSAEEVRQIAARLKQDRIPTDVIWLDIDYQDRNRPFTVNKTTFPDMKGLVDDMKKDGIKLVAITDLHVAAAADQGYTPYDTGIAGNDFVHNPDGSVYVGKVWPGPSVFPDFSDKSARKWWGTNYRQFVNDGIAGFWNDMNEPSVFDGPASTMPLDTVHHIDSDDFKTRNATHAEMHNVYGMLNTRATYEGLKALKPNERAFVMTRATYAGGQRYAVTWTGDNSSTWDHLKLSVHQLLNLGLSGFSYAGADVGGFTGGPSPDLLTRWYEIATFMPIFRNHSAKDTPRVEPWLDGPEHLAIRRRFIDERYRLMPYLYALADDNARSGDPLMRPVFYDYPQLASASCDQTMAFTLGSDLLIAPPPKPESPQEYEVCLPKGGWFDLWTGKVVKVTTPASDSEAVDKVKLTPSLDTLPVYVRAGTILPTQPLVQSTADTPVGPLTLHVYPGENCTGTIYLDDGHSMDFEKGHFLRQTVRCNTIGSGGLQISFDKRDGDYRPWWKDIQIVVHGWGKPATASVGGKGVATKVDTTADTLSITIPDMAGTSASVLKIEPATGA